MGIGGGDCTSILYSVLLYRMYPLHFLEHLLTGSKWETSNWEKTEEKASAVKRNEPVYTPKEESDEKRKKKREIEVCSTSSPTSDPLYFYPSLHFSLCFYPSLHFSLCFYGPST